MLVTVAFAVVIFFASLDLCSPHILSIIAKGDAVSCLDFWLYRYQTAITGLFAVLVAYAGLYVTTRKYKDEEEEKRLIKTNEMRRIRDEFLKTASATIGCGGAIGEITASVVIEAWHSRLASGGRQTRLQTLALQTVQDAKVLEEGCEQLNKLTKGIANRDIVDIMRVYANTLKDFSKWLERRARYAIRLTASDEIPAITDDEFASGARAHLNQLTSLQGRVLDMIGAP